MTRLHKIILSIYLLSIIIMGILAGISPVKADSQVPLLVIIDGQLTPQSAAETILIMQHAKPGQLIRIVINSPGGRLDAALAIIKEMKTNNHAEICEIPAFAASGAALIAGACNVVTASPTATILFHLPYYLDDKGVVHRDAEINSIHVRMMIELIQIDKLLGSRYLEYLLGKDVELTGTEFNNNLKLRG